MTLPELWHADAELRLELHAAAPGLHRYERHAHDEYSLIVLTCGSKLLRVGSEAHRVHAGQIVVIPPGTSHDCEPWGPTDWGHRCLYASPALAAQAAGEPRFAHDPPPLRAVIDAPDLAQAILDWHRGAERARASGQDATGLALIGEVLRRAATGRSGPAEGAGRAAQARLPHYLAALRRDLASKLDLDGLAALVGVTRFQVIRDIKAVLHTTPGGLLRDLRLREAKRLLRADVPISEVGALTGFADQSHLTRAFRGAYAVTPGGYRPPQRSPSTSSMS